MLYSFRCEISHRLLLRAWKHERISSSTPRGLISAQGAFFRSLITTPRENLHPFITTPETLI